MNAAYHRRFFVDIRFTTLAVIGLYTAAVGLDQPTIYLLIPVVALMGACQTAFDAYYLIFSRHYAATLEKLINSLVGRTVLIAHRIEDSYIFPLRDTKIVTLAFGAGFSWFGFMTAFYTLIGAASYISGLWLGLDSLTGGPPRLLYLGFLGVTTLGALVTGWWWFIGGAGERRLTQEVGHILDST